MPSSLLTFAGANYTQPLIPNAFEPAFATCSTSSAFYVWSHNKQLISYVGNANGEYSNNWNGSYSSTPSSNSSWTYSGTSQAGPHGHHYISFAPTFNTATSNGTNYYNTFYQTGQSYLYGAANSMCTGIWVNKKKRDNLCLQRANALNSYINRTQVSQLGSGALMSPIISTGNFTGATTTGTANGYNSNQSFGLVGYNENTGWWVNGQYSGSTATLYIYKNIPAPSAGVNLTDSYWNNFDNASKLTATFSLPSTSNYDAYHWKIIPLDNGNIMVVGKFESNYIYTALLTGNNGLNSTSWTANVGANTVGTTTSYHNSIWMDNLPAFVSYDGKYVFVYTQYYYYFSGLCGFVIRVSDGKVLRYNQSDTTYSFNAVMIGNNKMIVSYGSNTDGGTGQTLYEYDLEYLMEVVAANTDISGYTNLTRVDVPTSSTNYSMIWTVPSLIGQFNKGII